MSLAISVTYTIAGGFYVPGYQINVTGLSSVSNADTVLVQRRQLGDGAVTDVRGIAHVAVISDAATSVDYEYHYYSDNNGFVYDVYVYDTSGSQLATVTSTPTLFGIQSRTDLETSYPWTSAVMQSIQQPALSLPLIISQFSEWSYPGRILGEYNVLGRGNPVVLTDQMGGRTGSFSVLVNTALSTIRDDLFQLLFKYNDTFLFQPYYSSGNVGNFYFKIANVNATRSSIADSILSTLRTSTTTMLYTIDFIEVDRPIAGSIPFELISWQDVLNNNASWNTVKTSHADWLDVLNNPTT